MNIQETHNFCTPLDQMLNTADAIIFSEDLKFVNLLEKIRLYLPIYYQIADKGYFFSVSMTEDYQMFALASAGWVGRI